MTHQRSSRRRGSSRRDLLLVAVAAVAVAVDQASKAWAVDALQTRTIDVVWTLRLQLVHNSGAAFSLLSGRGAGPAIALVAVVVVVVLARTSRMFSSRWGSVAVGLVVGGALGNLADRAFRSHDGFLHGEVIDFVNLQWWPVFNVADACIVVGAIVLGVVAVFSPDDQPDEPAPAEGVGSAEAGPGGAASDDLGLAEGGSDAVGSGGIDSGGTAADDGGSDGPR